MLKFIIPQSFIDNGLVYSPQLMKVWIALLRLTVEACESLSAGGSSIVAGGSAKSAASGTAAPSVDASSAPDNSTADAPLADAPSPDAPSAATPSPDAPSADAPLADVPSPAVPSTDAPLAAAPSADAPSVTALSADASSTDVTLRLTYALLEKESGVPHTTVQRSVARLTRFGLVVCKSGYHETFITVFHPDSYVMHPDGRWVNPRVNPSFTEKSSPKENEKERKNQRNKKEKEITSQREEPTHHALAREEEVNLRSDHKVSLNPVSLTPNPSPEERGVRKASNTSPNRGEDGRGAYTPTTVEEPVVPPSLQERDGVRPRSRIGAYGEGRGEAYSVSRIEAYPSLQERDGVRPRSRIGAYVDDSKLSGRLEAFRREILAFEGKYNRAMLSDFFNYWTEPNRSHTKMRFELQPTWKTSLRLSTWARRDRRYAAGQPTVSAAGAQGASLFGSSNGGQYSSAGAGKITVQGASLFGSSNGGRCSSTGAGKITVQGASLFGSSDEGRGASTADLSSAGASCSAGAASQRATGASRSAEASSSSSLDSSFNASRDGRGASTTAAPHLSGNFNQPLLNTYSQPVNHGYSRFSYDALERADREERHRRAAELISHLAAENRPYQG